MILPLKYRVLLVACLLVTAGILPHLIPVRRGEAADVVDLAKIPTQFGKWHMVTQQINASPREKGFLNDVLFRVYRRGDGKRVALAIAYGADQRQNFSIHVPEGCYRASGYDVTSLGQARIALHEMETKSMVARKGSTTEAVQYWIVLNGQPVLNNFERKLKQLFYCLTGARAGGVLVRVSSPGPSRETLEEIFHVQRQFICSLHDALQLEQRQLIFGQAGRGNSPGTGSGSVPR